MKNNIMKRVFVAGLAWSLFISFPIDSFATKDKPLEPQTKVSSHAPDQQPGTKNQRGVSIPDALFNKIEIFTRMNSYDPSKLTAEKATFLITKTIERQEAGILYHGQPNPYHVDFSESLMYYIHEKNLNRLIDDIFNGVPSKEKVKKLLSKGSNPDKGKNVYEFYGIGLSAESEEVPYAGERMIPDPVIDRIQKLNANTYLAEITFFPKHSGPAQDFTEEDLKWFASQGITITDGYLFHYPKTYGRLIYRTLPNNNYQILYFTPGSQISKEVLNRFTKRP